MNKFSDNWSDGFDTNQQDDENWISKSEIKRQAEQLKQLGAELVALNDRLLAKIPLDNQLLEEIHLAQRIKREGKRRQLQLIGKLLRQQDVEPIKIALDKIKNHHHQDVTTFHTIENWRDALLEQGDAAISELLNQFPDIDRQQLRGLVRLAQKEKSSDDTAKYQRQLFQYLKKILQQK